MNSKDLQRVHQFCEERPAFTEPSIRWLIHNSHTNGLADAKAVVRIGAAVYLHVSRFDAWLEEQGAA